LLHSGIAGASIAAKQHRGYLSWQGGNLGTNRRFPMAYQSQPAAGYAARKERRLLEKFDAFFTAIGDRKSTRLNSSHNPASRMPSSA
jgi:hypothetical protein